VTFRFPVLLLSVLASLIFQSPAKMNFWIFVILNGDVLLILLSRLFGKGISRISELIMPFNSREEEEELEDVDARAILLYRL
jgi:hypothetical protein